MNISGQKMKQNKKKDCYNKVLFDIFCELTNEMCRKMPSPQLKYSWVSDLHAMRRSLTLSTYLMISAHEMDVNDDNSKDHKWSIFLFINKIQN